MQKKGVIPGVQQLELGCDYRFDRDEIMKFKKKITATCAE